MNPHCSIRKREKGQISLNQSNVTTLNVMAFCNGNLIPTHIDRINKQSERKVEE